MNEKLEEFIAKRCSNEIVNRLNEDKIDEGVIAIMTVAELERYIPHYGNRLALVAYAKQLSAEVEMPVLRSRNLLHKLRDRSLSRKQGASASQHVSRVLPQIGNSNARKKKLRLEIGWLDFSNNSFKQVKGPCGGGVRHLVLAEDTSMAYALEEAKKLFFPKGISKKGILTSYAYHICDFSQRNLPLTKTLRDLHCETKVKILRVYLATKEKVATESLCVDEHKDAIPQESSERECNKISSSVLPPKKCHHSEGNARTVDSTTAVSQSSETVVTESTSKEPSTGNTCMLHVQKNITISGYLEGANSALLEIDANPEEGQGTNYGEFESISDLLCVNNAVDVRSSAQDLACTLNIDSANMPLAMSNNMMTYSPSTMTTSNLVNDIANYGFDEEISFGASDFVSPCSLDDTLQSTVHTIQLHRGQVLQELIEYFMSNAVNLHEIKMDIQMILPNGKLEVGEDNGGVMRDILAEFWDTFYLKYTQGNILKVPNLTHRMTSRHWKACAQVIVMGYKQESYLPIELAPPFLRYAICGVRDGHTDLIDSFLSFLPEDEKGVVSTVLKKYEDVDMNDLLDLLESHDVRTVPTSLNVAKIIEEVAHKELIQAPAFVAECWRDVLQNHVFQLENAIQSLTPCAKKVLKILQFQDGMSKDEEKCAGYLKKYVKSCTIDTLKKFLRFCTGADILVRSSISVRFVPATSEFRRSPVAHTCGCVLEIQDTYDSMQEIRQEFDGIFHAGVWVMDII